jgi:hypothetical protein
MRMALGQGLPPQELLFDFAAASALESHRDYAAGPSGAAPHARRRTREREREDRERQLRKHELLGEQLTRLVTGKRPTDAEFKSERRAFLERLTARLDT